MKLGDVLIAFALFALESIFGEADLVSPSRPASVADPVPEDNGLDNFYFLLSSVVHLSSRSPCCHEIDNNKPHPTLPLCTNQRARFFSLVS